MEDFRHDCNHSFLSFFGDCCSTGVNPADKPLLHWLKGGVQHVGTVENQMLLFVQLSRKPHTGASIVHVEAGLSLNPPFYHFLSSEDLNSLTADLILGRKLLKVFEGPIPSICMN